MSQADEARELALSDEQKAKEVNMTRDPRDTQESGAHRADGQQTSAVGGK
jgi:hypothetical protein